MIREKIPPKKVPTKQKMKMYGSEKWLFTPHGTNQWSNLVFWDKATESQRGLVEFFYLLLIDIQSFLQVSEVWAFFIKFQKLLTRKVENEVNCAFD